VATIILRRARPLAVERAGGGARKRYNRESQSTGNPDASGSQWWSPLEQEEVLALTPQVTYFTLLVAQALHLLHHRLAKRHISFAEVISGAILCVPLTLAIPATVYMSAHLTMVAVQVVGSLWIRRLSPAWS
jgi:hypothetical protein